MASDTGSQPFKFWESVPDSNSGTGYTTREGTPMDIKASSTAITTDWAEARMRDAIYWTLSIVPGSKVELDAARVFAALNSGLMSCDSREDFELLCNRSDDFLAEKAGRMDAIDRVELFANSALESNAVILFSLTTAGLSWEQAVQAGEQLEELVGNLRDFGF